jgi:hypothetical protein
VQFEVRSAHQTILGSRSPGLVGSLWAERLRIGAVGPDMYWNVL